MKNTVIELLDSLATIWRERLSDAKRGGADADFQTAYFEYCRVVKVLADLEKSEETWIDS